MSQCEIAKQFFSMLQEISAEQKIPRDYGSGQMLFHSELDLLEKIHQNPDSNVSRLSALCCVTKSAITQSSNKLSEKGLIEKYTVGNNKKERYFRLLQEGEDVRLQHQKYHEEAAAGLRQYLCSLTGEAREIIMEFMEKMKEYPPVCVFPCQHDHGGQACETSLLDDKEKLC